MRLSNRNKAPLFQFYFTALLMLIVGGIGLFFIERYRLDFMGKESYLLIIVPIVLFVIFYMRGRQIFEYDSDGEALNFKNRSVVGVVGKIVSDEFPKYKLLKFEIVDALILKKLYITISSKKSNAIVLKYDISYLSGKEIKDLRFSLNKVVKANKENKRDNNNQW